MKFEELYDIAVIWTCYLEHFPEPERYLNIYGLNHDDVLKFDRLGSFFPFEEFYVRCPGCEMAGARENLMLSKKGFILPWIYWPKGTRDELCGKEVISPSAEMFVRLDNKVEVKHLFKYLGIPTPRWDFSGNGGAMLEKPVRNSAGGLGISLTDCRIPHHGCFLEDYIPGYASVGLQFFAYDEVEFICADEMLFEQDGGATFTFHRQRNIRREDIPRDLMEDCFRLVGHLLDRGYRGFIGIDALVGEHDHYLIEINPRGIAFLPAYFAASSRGWTNFETYVEKDHRVEDAFTLLDFGERKKVIRQINCRE